MIEICVVGAGKIFQLYHLKSINLIDSIKIKHVVDKNFDLAKRVASDIGAIPHENLDEKIDCENFFITVPPKFRIQVFDSIKDYAKNIIFEKPVTLTHSEAQYINEVSQKKDINVLVAQTRRFFPNLQFTKELFKVNSNSKISISAHEGALFNWSSESNYFNNDNPNDHGVFHDVGSHIFDYVVFFIESFLDFKNLTFKVLDSKFDSIQNSNNSYSNLRITGDKIEIEVKVRLSRSSNLSNQITIKDNMNSKLLTRSLMSREVKLIGNSEIIPVPVKGINQSFDLDDVFYNMWLDIENTIQTNSVENSRLGLDSVLNTVKLMQYLIDKKQVEEKLEFTYYE